MRRNPPLIPLILVVLMVIVLVIIEGIQPEFESQRQQMEREKWIESILKP